MRQISTAEPYPAHRGGSATSSIPMGCHVRVLGPPAPANFDIAKRKMTGTCEGPEARTMRDLRYDYGSER